MEIVYDKSTGTWSERQEPYTTLDVQTEEDWNKLEFMINNFSKLEEENDTLKTELMAVKSGSDVLKICKLEEENAELKRLLRLAVEDFCKVRNVCDKGSDCRECPCDLDVVCKWKHADEVKEILEDEK